ncbi:MAG: DegT/DnrJ/EryC1/StrS family aminotransferase, partial [Vulcanimicrobiota bacterium]
MECIPRILPRLTSRELSEIEADIRNPGSHNEGKIETFEVSFARYVGRKYAFYVPSAKYGLYHLLKCLNLKDGDMVIIPAFCHPYIPAMVIAAGLVPLFADVEENSCNLSVTTIPLPYWNMAKAMIVSHLFGNPAPVNDLMDMAKENGLIVIEDCSMALGATIFGQMLGKFGRGAFFDLSYNSNLTLFEGGMVVTDDSHIKDKILSNRAEDFITIQELARKYNNYMKIQSWTTGGKCDILRMLLSVSLNFNKDFIQEYLE